MFCWISTNECWTSHDLRTVVLIVISHVIQKNAARYYLCTDSSGVSIGTSRVVEVGVKGRILLVAFGYFGLSGVGPT